MAMNMKRLGSLLLVILFCSKIVEGREKRRVHVATITSVTPHQLQRTTARTLNLVIENLPSSPGRLLCTFTAIGKTLSNGFATRTENGVSCTTPRNDLLPSIPYGESHFTSKLSVRMLDGPEYAATNFTFFDCNSFSSCTSCVSSLFPCDWCVDGHRCTHDTAENCRNDILVSGINTFGPRIRSGPSFCPRINSTVEGSSEVLVASGLTKSIQVKVEHIAFFIIQSRFVCQFNIEGRVTSVNAQLLKDTIYCDEMEFIYTSRNRANITATFAVIWGGSKPLDNPENIHVVIYKCDEMAKDCGTCLIQDDKYKCGWCQAEEGCQVEAQCGRGGESWLDQHQSCGEQQIAGDNITAVTHDRNLEDISPHEAVHVATITSVTPHQLQRTTARTLNLVIENLPSSPGRLLCTFTAIGKTLSNGFATRTATGVSCTTPRNDLWPSIPYGESHFTSKLSVRMLDGPEYAATNFTFFDCNSFSSCTSCVSSLFPCDWCLDGHRCTHDTAQNCRNDILVTGINRIGSSIGSGPRYCPRINATVEGSPQVLVASGLQKSIRVKVDNIAQFILQTRFFCQFNIGGRVTSVNAQLLSDTIYCDGMEFIYTSRSPYVTASFAVIWGGSKPLDNPDNIHVVIYKCDEFAQDCGTCLIMNDEYKCGWCQASRTCKVEAKCGTGNHENWISRNQTCPSPRGSFG